MRMIAPCPLASWSYMASQRRQCNHVDLKTRSLGSLQPHILITKHPFAGVLSFELTLLPLGYHLSSRMVHYSRYLRSPSGMIRGRLQHADSGSSDEGLSVAVVRPRRIVRSSQTRLAHPSRHGGVGNRRGSQRRTCEYSAANPLIIPLNPTRPPLDTADRAIGKRGRRPLALDPQVISRSD